MILVRDMKRHTKTQRRPCEDGGRDCDYIVYRFWYKFQYIGVFPTTPSNSPTQLGTIQLISDTIYPEIVSDSTS